MHQFSNKLPKYDDHFLLSKLPAQRQISEKKPYEPTTSTSQPPSTLYPAGDNSTAGDMGVTG